MRKILVNILFLTFVLISTVSWAAEMDFKINGIVKLPDFEGKRVSLITYEAFHSGGAYIDSTIIKNGKYTFSGSVKSPSNYYIHLDSDAEFNPNTVIVIDVALEQGVINVITDENRKSSVSGTKNNEVYQQFREEYGVKKEKLVSLFNLYEKAASNNTLSKEMQEDLQNKMDAEIKMLHDYTFYFIKNNINNPLAWSEIDRVAPDESVERLKELISGANAVSLENAAVKAIAKQIKSSELTANGSPFIDFELPDIEGNLISLSDYAGKGKLVLLDFWASWCAPCRASIPHLKELYAKYKEKGFEIIGVSLDSKKDAWIGALKQLNMPWPQLSDVKGWDCEAAKLYGVSGIPHTVLIDAEGKILASGLGAKELDAALDNIFK